MKKRKLMIVKRDKTKEEFNSEKIGIAIKKAFDEVGNKKYNEKDVFKVTSTVVEEILINEHENNEIDIETIQNLNEKKLKDLGYTDIYEAFKTYRQNRLSSRNNFSNRIHKMTKIVEKLIKTDSKENDVKRENGNIDGDSPMGAMLHYGTTLSKEIAKAYMMDEHHAHLHDEGYIHIHDMDFMPTGTVTCCQIDLKKLFTNGFSTGHGSVREPQSIMAYAALSAIAIQANQNDHHGGQSIPAFDHYLAPGVLKTFKKELKQMIYDVIDFNNLLDTVDIDKVIEKITSLDSINIDIKKEFNEFKLEKIDLEKIYDKVLKKTDRMTYQAMEAFVFNMNTMHSRAGAQVPFSSINLGTSTTEAGRMVIKNLLLAMESGLGRGETSIFPIVIFKVKEGVNYFENDPNYDLFELACRVSSKRLFPTFSFIDAPFNKQYYVEGDIDTEIAYMGCRTRVIGNVYDKTNEKVTSRGNLSWTTINLPRLGIKHGSLVNDKLDIKGFYKELENLMIDVKTQLLNRLKIQSSKHVYNFPFLMKQGVWYGSEKLGPFDTLEEVLKQGTLGIGIIGLAECLKALIGEHHGESEEAQKLGIEILTFMRNILDNFAEEYKLNFSLVATPGEGLSGRFINIDKSIYGKIKGVTDKEYYTNSSHVPVYYNINAEKKIELEAPYQALCNGGHISYVELDGEMAKNPKAFMSIIKLMRKHNIGYGAINHPIDSDPVCGYQGIINDVCPQCGRVENEHEVGFARIRRITGYLVGTLDKFNNAKKGEERDRVKHTGINVDES